MDVLIGVTQRVSNRKCTVTVTNLRLYLHVLKHFSGCVATSTVEVKHCWNSILEKVDEHGKLCFSLQHNIYSQLQFVSSHQVNERHYER